MGHAHQPRPLGLKHAGLTASLNPARICPFCEGKMKEQLFTSRYLHETGTRGGWGPHPVPAVLPGATPHGLNASALRRAHHLPPSAPFFWLCQKPILNGKFPRKLRQSWVTPKSVIRN